MNDIRDMYSGRSLKSADKRWHEIEHDIDLLEQRKHRFHSWVEHFKIPYDALDLTEYDGWNDQIRRLVNEQQRLEEFLIENEYPGWTST